MNKANHTNKKIRLNRAPRVAANIPVLVRDGSKGITENISATGISMELDESYVPGSTISFSLELDTNGEKIVFICDAEVVRVEQANGKVKIASKIIKQELQALNQ